MDSFYINYLDLFICNIKCVLLVLLLLYFIDIPVFNANSVDPDQRQCSVASDLEQHRLSMSILYAGHKWVKRR